MIAHYINSPNPEAAKMLLKKIQSLSERLYCAGWADSLEFHLWGILKEDAPLLDGMEPGDLAEIKTLSQECQGFWAWNDQELTETFFQKDQMEGLYEEWKKKRG